MIDFRYLIIAILTFLLNLSEIARSADSQKPLSEGASSVVTEKSQPSSELILILGNESNPPDGTFGPFTYGLRGNHRFENNFDLEAGYIRLHEPKTSIFNWAIDEAQLTMKSPELEFLGAPYVIDLTGWKNRMVDMYTNIGGLEVTKVGTISLNFGLYSGNATRNEIEGQFFGGQVGVSGSISQFELAAGYMRGTIGQGGLYQRIAINASTDIANIKKLPVTLTLDVEDRYFNFGKGGPASEAADEFIFVTGLEIHLMSLP